MKIKIQDKLLEYSSPVTVYDAAKDAELITRAVIGAEIDGVTVALTHELTADAEVRLLTFADAAGKHLFRHTAAHVLAQAVKRLYPAAKLTIGPAIDNGYYYDIDSDVPFGADALKAIEGEMKKIVKENLKIERFELPREEAIALMKEKDEPYKVQLIEELPEDATISFYKQGEFTDLCAGPHLFSTGAIKAFKLTQCTGAYWKGDQKNKMLQRIYGIAYPSKDEMNEYLKQQEEALKRDHNKLGRELVLLSLISVSTVLKCQDILMKNKNPVVKFTIRLRRES